MPLITWPLLWMLFMLGLCVAFGIVAMQEAKARKQAAKELQASQQAMAGVGADMAPAEGFDDGFGQPAEFAEFDENAFK